MLNRLMRSSEAEFLALYGRRRVGKTFLIREHFKRQLCFELTGTRDAPLHDQLAEFHDALGRRSRKRREAPGSWREAFQQLGEHLRTLRGRGKRVIFLDELPWLAGPRSRFLPALDHFWNAELSRDPRNVLVICGSAASWMIAKVIDHKGGLHNRVTAHMRLEPFTLGESERYFASRRIKLTRYDQLTLAMVVGGVPHYLKEAQRGWSAAQVIDRTCFAKLGLLRGEFDRVYASLFAHSERHVMLVRRLAAHPHGLTRTELAKSYGSGGRLTQTLRELEEAGFVGVQEPFGNKRKDMLYRLIDEYSLFYLKWIEKRRASGRGTFLKKVGSPALACVERIRARISGPQTCPPAQASDGNRGGGHGGEWLDSPAQHDVARRGASGSVARPGRQCDQPVRGEIFEGAVYDYEGLRAGVAAEGGDVRGGDGDAEECVPVVSDGERTDAECLRE